MTKILVLNDEQKKSNTEESKIRVRVEYVLTSLNISCPLTKLKQVWLCIRFGQYFGFMEQSRYYRVNGLVLKSVGIIQASGIIGLINFTYNLFRYEQVIRLNIL